MQQHEGSSQANQFHTAIAFNVMSRREKEKNEANLNKTVRNKNNHHNNNNNK